jgi:hypothetical protein
MIKSAMLLRFFSRKQTSISLACASIYLLTLTLSSYMSFRWMRGGFWYRWWDILHVRMLSPTCSAQNVFYGVSPIRVSCDDRRLAEWINLKLKDKTPLLPIVIPAQTLFYRTLAFGPKRKKYLTITWNDFMNRRQSLQSAQEIARLDKARQCELISGMAILLFRTPKETMRSSAALFGKQGDLGSFEQEAIEKTILAVPGGGCFDRHETKYKQQLVVLLSGR